MAEGLYRIGECIFMEVYPPPMPYQICKIEELRKNSKGSVEVAAKCFYRRKDLPANLLVAADRHALAVEEESDMDSTTTTTTTTTALDNANNFDKLSDLEKHMIRHRELFLSRQIETYKIDMVRGKCTVSLLNELEDVHTYLEKEDTFFYTMVYDPNQKTLLVDKGEIRIGPDYQAEIPPYILPDDRETPTHQASQVWEPNRMPDHKVEQFLVVARSIGTFARALLDGAKKPQISLRLGAAAASRDITLFHAMDTLHQNTYDITQATSCLVPRGPVLCADELEAWTQEEAKRFEDGLQEQKDFLYIQKKYLLWKPVKSIVAYYYMWKTTDRYQIQKRHRMIEKQNDLKEVIVHLRTPSGAPAGPRDLSGKAASSGSVPASLPTPGVDPPTAPDGEKACESCLSVSANRWYQWGPAHEHCRLCSHCYVYWRKYGGLKLPTRWESTERRVPGINLGGAALQVKRPKDRPAGQPRTVKKSKGREDKHKEFVPPSPFYMRPTGLTIFMRHKLGSAVLQKAGRIPFTPITVAAVQKPSAEMVEHFLSVKRKGRRKPRLSEPTLVSLKQNVTNSPMKQLIPRPSPTPISPSYKRTSSKGSKSKMITTSGIYMPPKSQSQSPPQPVGGPSPPTLTSAHTQLSTSTAFLPPSGEPEGPLKGYSRKRKLEIDADTPASKAAKVPRPPSPTATAPGELLFKADSGTRLAREQLGRAMLLQAARSPWKTIDY